MHLDRNTLLQVGSKHVRIGPVQLPAFIDSHQPVTSWNDIEQQEAAVGIALVAPEQNLVVLCILGREQHHDSARRTAIAFRHTFDLTVPVAGYDLKLWRGASLHL